MYEFNVPMSVLGLGERTKTYDLSCPRAKCQKKLQASDKNTCRATQKTKHGRGRPIVLFLTSWYLLWKAKGLNARYLAEDSKIAMLPFWNVFVRPWVAKCLILGTKTFKISPTWLPKSI